MERRDQDGANPVGNGVALRRDREPTFSDHLWRNFQRSGLTAFGASLLVHLVTLIILGFVVLPYGGGGGGGDEPLGEIGVAIVSEGELDRLQQGSLDLNAPSVPEAVGSDPASEDLLTASMGDEAAGGVGEVTDVGAVAGGGDIGGIGTGLGGGAGGGGASFFGVEARGNRFAYIVDVSGSMAEGEKMFSLRRELTESITQLMDTAQFVVVGFSDDAQPMGGKAIWRDSTTTGKRWARDAVNALLPQGGTVPYPAFEVVFAIKPRPDAIYFMTDGEFDPALADLIKELQKGSKIPVHCICFVSKGSEEQMKRIAKETGGAYRFVP